MDALWILQAAALQLKDAGLLIAEQILAAEAIAVGPEQIEPRLEVADQEPGLVHCQAGGGGHHQIGAAAAISPEPHTAQSPALTGAGPAGCAPHSPAV